MERKRGDGKVVQGDFSRRDSPDDEPLPVPGESSVSYVGFHSTKCPTGTMARHARFGMCEVVWADRLERRIRYWVGEAPDHEERQVTVPVQELMPAGR